MTRQQEQLVQDQIGEKEQERYSKQLEAEALEASYTAASVLVYGVSDLDNLLVAKPDDLIKKAKELKNNNPVED